MTWIWDTDVDGAGTPGWRRGAETIPWGDGVGYVAGWGLPDWQDEMSDRLDWKAANPGGGELDPARWNIRDRDQFGLTMDSAEPRTSQVLVDAEGRLVLRGEWLPDAPRSRSTSSSGVDVLTHLTGYVDHRTISGNQMPGVTPISTRYGRWEVRAKVPTGPNTRGTLAAFWLRNGSTGEIDIMESWGGGGTMHADWTTYVRNRSTFTTFENTSTGAGKSFWRYEQELGLDQDADPVHAAYHTWALEWTADYLAAFRDGQQIVRLEPGDQFTDASGVQQSADKYWTDPAYDSPWHVRMNLHIGPSYTYWGVPDSNDQATTQDPVDYLIEHVRVWSL